MTAERLLACKKLLLGVARYFDQFRCLYMLYSVNCQVQ